MTRHFSLRILVAAFAVLLLLVAAHFVREANRGGGPQSPFVHQQLSAASAAFPTEPTAEKEAGQRLIRVALSAAFVSEAGVPVYGKIVDYLQAKLGQECEYVTGFSYSTIDAMLDRGLVDVGFICGLPYVLKHDQENPTVELLAAPVMKAKQYNDQPKYSSYVIVHKDSDFKSFADLKGCTYVYNDRLSNSGYNMPRARLIELGETDGFFGKVLQSGSHAESIRAVASKQADASSVDSLVFADALARGAENVQEVKVIEVLGPAGIPPVVTSNKVPRTLRKRIQDVLDRAKSEFLANMSHELRTPLHGILSFAGFGAKRHASARSERLLDYFQEIQQSGKTLMTLLNDLLDLAKLESDRTTLEFQPADLGALISSVTDEFRSMTCEQDLAIHWTEPVFQGEVVLDTDKIRQVLRNLLNNAVKFSPKGGAIKLEMQRGEDVVTVTVRDRGPGIPEDEWEAVFDKFVQSSKTKSGTGGTGLGLAICRQIIAAHGGRIWAQNHPEGGAVFSFEIPVCTEASKKAEPVSVAGAGELV